MGFNNPILSKIEQSVKTLHAISAGTLRILQEADKELSKTHELSQSWFEEVVFPLLRSEGKEWPGVIYCVNGLIKNIKVTPAIINSVGRVYIEILNNLRSILEGHQDLDNEIFVNIRLAILSFLEVNVSKLHTDVALKLMEGLSFFTKDFELGSFIEYRLQNISTKK